MDSFHKLIFQGMNWSNLEFFFKHSIYLEQNLQSIAQNYQFKPSNKAEGSFVCSLTYFNSLSHFYNP